MAFGKQSGPPASHQQMNDLIALLQTAGHTDFRDARGPMGFTQRQAGGKFTRDEAQQFIDQLEEAENERATSASARLQIVKPPEASSALQNVPSDDLAAELRRRGWTASER
jgi:hypothetical protein